MDPRIAQIQDDRKVRRAERIFSVIPPSLVMRIAWISLAIACLTSTTSAGTTLQQIPTVLHVHTTWSTGSLSLDDLVARCRKLGIGAVFLTENHLQSFEYGLFPLRGLLRYRIQFPSLAKKGTANFLRAVAEINAKQKEVLIIPGAEIIPHYYWIGSLFQNTLTMYNAQKNILALGLSRSADYEEMPATGNYGAGRWGLETIWLLSPAVLIIPGVILLRTKRRQVIRTRSFAVRRERRLIWPGLACLGLAIALLINNYPFRRAPQSMYDSEAGLRPHQEVIDFISSRGGVAVWSMPEAIDYQTYNIWKFRATIRTDKYPSDLLHTDRFAAFGGLYEDTRPFVDPGQGWDRLLHDYVEGFRTAAWAVAESGYHYEGHAGKRFGEIQTVLLADRKDPATLLSALRSGRAYSLQRNEKEGLILERFQIVAPGKDAAEAGSEVVFRSADRPELHIAVASSTGQPVPIEVRLIRSGTVVHAIQGKTPFTLQWADTSLPPKSRHFYRLVVRGSGHEILSNPIFVRAT